MKTRFLSGLLGAAATVSGIISTTAIEAKALTSDFPEIPQPSVMRNADDSHTPLLTEIIDNFVQDEKAFLNDAGLYELDASTLTFAYEAKPVEIYLIDEGAGFTTNDLLVSINGGSKQTVFGDIACPDCTLKEDHGKYLRGDGVSLGFQPAGTSLDLSLSVLDLFNYTAPGELNPDGLQHIVAFKFGEWTILGFEDLYGPDSDRDFNDVVLAIRGVRGVAANPQSVPEPSAMVALFGMGAFGLLGLRRRKN